MQGTATTRPRSAEYDYQAMGEMLAVLERAATDSAFFDGLLTAHRIAGRPDIADSAAAAVASIQRQNTIVRPETILDGPR
jgi:hypothetical protein